MTLTKNMLRRTVEKIDLEEGKVITLRFRNFLREYLHLEYVLMPNIIGDQFRTNPKLNRYANYNSIMLVHKKEFKSPIDHPDNLIIEMSNRQLAIDELEKGNMHIALLCYKHAISYRLNIMTAVFGKLHLDDRKIVLDYAYADFEKKIIEHLPYENFDLNKYLGFMSDVLEYRLHLYELKSEIINQGQVHQSKIQEYNEVIKLQEQAHNYLQAQEIARRFEDFEEVERLEKLLDNEPIHPELYAMVEIKKIKKKEAHAAADGLTQGVREDDELGCAGKVGILSKFYTKIIF